MKHLSSRLPGIRIKVIFAGILLITAVVTAMATYVIQTETALLKGELKKRATALVENFTRLCDYPLLLEDAKAIDKLVAAMMEEEDVAGLSVATTDGRVLSLQTKENTPPLDLTALPSAPPTAISIVEQPSALVISMPIWTPSESKFRDDFSPGPTSRREPLGRVSVGFSLNKTNALIRQTVSSTVAIAGGITAVTILVLLYLLDRLMAPLLLLVQGIRKISAGNLSHRVDIRRNDEIGELAVAFNEMAQNLELGHRQLEVSNQTLEERVRSRTAELRNSEARYRAFFESTGTAMVMFEEDGTISLVNAEFEELFGYRRSEAEGRMTWSALIAEQNRAETEEYREQCLRNPHQTPKHWELQILDRDGRTKEAYIILSPIPGTLKTIGSLIDISQRKQLEKRLQQIQKMEAIGTLAGGIAHDFNNLLMGIQGYASLMLLTVEQDHPHREQLTQIEEYVQSGANLTRQLLGFARGGQYEIRPINLNEVIEKTSTMFGRTKKEILIERQYEPALWIVEADRSQIEQIFLNLYVNAWQAMPGGGVLYLETANVELGLDSSRVYDVPAGRYAKVSVTDSGMGMDEKTKNRIFEPFFTTKEMGRGTGLGLATVYGIVRGHKGIITVYSEKGHGTSFHIYLPASDKAIAQESPSVVTIVRGTETILVVDDEEGIVRVSRSLLEALGYRVLATNSGREAVEMYRRDPASIDLVMLDMIMPELSGGDTFDLLKALNPQIRVILSSGYSLNEAAGQIMQRGCRGFIQKPYTLQSLSVKVREVLDQP